jgi:hypothetical protein
VVSAGMHRPLTALGPSGVEQCSALHVVAICCVAPGWQGGRDGAVLPCRSCALLSAASLIMSASPLIMSTAHGTVVAVEVAPHHSCIQQLCRRKPMVGIFESGTRHVFIVQFF